MHSPIIVTVAAVLVCWLIAWLLARSMMPGRHLQTGISVIDLPSPNFDSRNGAQINVLVLHYTAIKSTEASLRVLCDGDAQNRVSAHYVVSQEGQIYRLVDEAARAWHAGISSWSGQSGLNASSIGIEIVNDGDSPFPAAQMAAVISLSQDIVTRNNIAAHNVIAHSDIAPSRKQDPGKYFDWKGLAQAGLGVFPQPEKQDYDLSATWGEADFADALVQYGYTDGSDFKTKLTAFQRHFQQGVFFDSDSSKIGAVNPEAGARLAWLLRNGLR